MKKIEREKKFGHYYSLFLAALLFVLFVSPGKANCADSAAPPEWKELSYRKGIRVFSRKIPGSRVIAFKGIVTIDAHIGVIINTIDDKSRHKEWVDRLMESRTLEQYSPFESIEYTKVNCPWPISDRDFVFHSAAVIDEENKQVVMNMRSVTSPLMPPARGVVRGDLNQSLYTITRVDEGKTRVEVEFYGDPRGWIPIWVANIFQRRWPYITLTQMRNQATRPEIKEAYNKYDSLSRYYTSTKQAGRDDLQGPYQVSKSGDSKNVKAKAVSSNPIDLKTVSHTVKDKISVGTGVAVKKSLY